MTVTAQTFYPHSTDWDGTDPASGDVRKCETSVPAAGTGSTCDFGTSGAKTITVDPFTAGRTTTGVSSAFGWAINISGVDGMDGAADTHRFIPAGVWTFQGTLHAAPSASLAAVTVNASVYRVAASPSTTRTLLFSSGVSAGLILTTGTSWTHTTGGQQEIELEAGETIQVSFDLTCTGQLGGLTIDFHTGTTALLNTCLITVPTPGVRTIFLESVQATAVGTATVIDGVKTITGTVYTSASAPASGATAKLFRQSDDVKISTFTTGGDGVYTFTRGDDDTDEWYVVGYSDSTHHGTTDRGIVAT